MPYLALLRAEFLWKKPNSGRLLLLVDEDEDLLLVDVGGAFSS